MPGANQFKAEDFIKAISGTGGIISAIARKMGCDWHTAKRYIARHPTIRAAYDDECESVLDLAEAKTIELLKEKDGPMLRYYLSTKGKHRGYVGRQEMTGSDGGPVEISMPDAVAAVRAALAKIRDEG